MNNQQSMEILRAVGIEPTPTLSVEDAGRVLGVGRGLAYRLARSGKLPTVRVGRLLRVPLPKLLELLEGENPAGQGGER
jgi:excisionase family DNA binding protein